MTLHIGILGGGNISGTHARVVTELPDARLAAICGENQDVIDRMAEPHGAATYRDLEAFLAHRPMEAVIIGSPSGLHAEHAIAAAKEGLHVLVEKPLDVTTARVDEMIAAFQAAGTTLGVIYQERVAPDLVWLRRMIGRGELGTVFLVSARVKWYRDPDYYAGSRWRGDPAFAGGGALMNQGTHTVDLLLWLLGDVRHVHARTRTFLHDTRVEDTAIAILEFASGAVATLEATTAAYPGYPRQVEITGSNGTVTVVGDQVRAVDLRSPPSEQRPASVADDSPRANSPLISDTTAHRAVIENFLQALREGVPPICDGPDGRRSVAVVEAIYRSAASGATVAL